MVRSPLKTLPITIYLSWLSFMTKWWMIQNIYYNICTTSCANTHDIATFEIIIIISKVIIIKIINLWLRQEHSITFKWNLKIFELGLRDYIFRIHHFLMERFSLKVISTFLWYWRLSWSKIDSSFSTFSTALISESIKVRFLRLHKKFHD